MSATPDVLAPASLGPVRLRNRIVKAATFEGRTPDGQVTDALVDYHLEVARGGIGMTTLAYLAVAPEGRTHREQVVVGPATEAGLARLAEAVHDAGAAVAGQVGHAGPVANGRSNGVRAIAASRMPSPLSMQLVAAATEADLTRVTGAYVATARTLARAGFDCLELHMAHSYLVSSFLAPGLNRRTDRWGGSLENRARLARQVARAVREEVGDAVAVTAKLSLSDGFRGGVSTDEAVEVAQLLEADGCLDALQLSGGSSLMNPMYLFRGDVPHREFAAAMGGLVGWGMRTPMGRSFLKSYPFEEAYFRDKALRVREAVDLPLMLLGGINRLDTMEQAMADGFEYVALARAVLREPGLVDRVARERAAGRSGEGACIHCNRCMPTIYAGTHCPVRDAARAADPGGRETLPQI
ncbi:NADH:flavin oxidoreductase [Nocardioides sp. 31GB23]|uniref:2,4-dienoyl-CoA reductase-like NADH-dependent reductase (Old Yellow Enzyme family) n=1 Tax=Nocardioides salarius TaxID=374513 RepID=A0ABS2M9E6_9ACTN|nr:NADH:flavin oxidoreductase [Nocardioides salarius]MBM7507782.1 2,4-dienoyl-CoA reductase-like NADH-dependent reductase (Old Yellow Enzyme family) [Nocardioides salarius]